MMDWEGRFNALVRRLVEIADYKTKEKEHPDMDRLTFYDRVARAHEKDIGENG